MKIDIAMLEHCTAFLASLLIMPPLIVGIIRKTKARFQNRIGAPITQPFFDLLKLLSKSETISKHTSWIFRSTAAVNVSLLLLLAFLAPWTSFHPFNKISSKLEEDSLLADYTKTNLTNQRPKFLIKCPNPRSR